jgi:hypothetical protein
MYIGYDVKGNSLYYDTVKVDPLDDMLRIPSLSIGNIKDVTLEDVNYVHKGNYGAYFKGLKSYILSFTQQGTPNYVFDNHNHALYAWCEALHNRRIQKGATLIHFDSHLDHWRPDNYNFDVRNLKSVRDYVTKLKICVFIAPAFVTGIVRKFIWVNPMDEASVYKDNTDDNLPAPFIEIGIDSPLLEPILRSTPRKKIIIDIDYDYFDPHISSPYNLGANRFTHPGLDLYEHDLRIIKDATSYAGVITNATSPDYIDQQKAVEIIWEMYS